MIYWTYKAWRDKVNKEIDDKLIDKMIKNMNDKYKLVKRFPMLDHSVGEVFTVDDKYEIRLSKKNESAPWNIGAIVITLLVEAGYLVKEPSSNSLIGLTAQYDAITGAITIFKDCRTTGFKVISYERNYIGSGLDRCFISSKDGIKFYSCNINII